MPHLITSLTASWFKMCRELGSTRDATEKRLYQELLSRYDEHHRAYHTIEHIKWCLTLLRFVRDLIPPRGYPILQFALWYHHSVYDPRSKTNEADSARLAVFSAQNLGLSSTVQTIASDLILLTKHDKVPISPLGDWMVDIDLAILGRPLKEYETYESQIRMEYAWVPLEEYAKARSAILQSFLDRECIYRTSYFFDQFENRALRNLKRSIKQLKS